MINPVRLAAKLRGKAVTRDEDMPPAYRQGARPLHDDWGIVTNNPILRALQPWQKITRMSTTYLLPLPAKLLRSRGPIKPEWFPRQKDYPMSPGAEVAACSWKVREGFLLPDPNGDIEAFLTYNPTLPVGQSATFACWIDNEWVECYYTATFMLLGMFKKTFNIGMKFDLVDPMWNFPEWSFS